ASRVIHAHDRFPRALEDLDDPTLPTLAATTLLDARHDTAPVDRRAHGLPRHEQVIRAILGDHESGSAPDGLESPHDQIDLLGGRVALTPDPVEQALILEPLQLLLEFRVVMRIDAQSLGQFLRLQWAPSRVAQVIDDLFGLD